MQGGIRHKAGYSAIAVGEWMNEEQAVVCGRSRYDCFEVSKPSESFLKSPHKAREGTRANCYVIANFGIPSPHLARHDSYLLAGIGIGHPTKILREQIG